jgi:penicillin amidase
VRRIILLANLFIAVLFVAAAGYAWWLAWRPLAVTSGTLDLPVSAPVTVIRDNLGVPHIIASNIEDAVVAQGFVTAQDRLFQMDGMRRMAAGELAEIIGAGGLENDQEARNLRLKRVAEAHARSLSQPDRALMAAYARGVNHYIATHKDKLPVEFNLLSYDPRPWAVSDTILVGLQMFRSLTSTWKDDVLRGQLRGKGDREKIDFLFPVRTGSEEQMGSNAWVVSGKHTASGKPILANDTHLEWSWPGAWYMVHLKAPDLNVTGFALPGVPAVIIGHNERIAWGVTNLQFDVQDLYLEEFDPAAGRYRFDGKLESARLETETIRVKGRGPIGTKRWVTRHGPVVIQQGAAAVALRWVAYEPNGFDFPFLEINRAGNWDAFQAALRRYPGPAQNFVYADVDGNIGYRAAGRIPIRKGYLGDAPVSGAGGYEWQGFVPFEEMPAAYNPPSGMLVTANQNPFKGTPAFGVNGNFASHYRQRQIVARLRSKQGWKAEQMLRVQTDVYSSFSHSLARQTVAAWNKLGRGNRKLAAPADSLAKWDGQMSADSAAAFIATLVYQHVRRAVAGKAIPGQGASYESQMAPAVIDRLLSERPPGWFADYDAMLLNEFDDAVAEAEKLQGADPAKWSYGRYTRFSLSHPVLSRVPWVGKYFVLGPAPMAGALTTVKQTSRRLGPSMRFVADLADWEASLANVTVGQSGQPLSGHFNDQWWEYLAGRSFPMRFAGVSGEKLEFRPIP